jgi:hypothetical protein
MRTLQLSKLRLDATPLVAQRTNGTIPRSVNFQDPAMTPITPRRDGFTNFEIPAMEVTL